MDSRSSIHDEDPQHVDTNSPHRDVVQILSYNIFLRPPLISSDNGGDYKNERLKLIIENVLPDQDIICFQEMFTKMNWRQEKLLKYAKSKGFNFYASPPGPPCCSTFLINSGLLTISKHKILKTDFHPFEHGSGADRLAYKGILYTRILVNNKYPMNLFNTHLQAHYDFKDHRNIRSRLNQIAQLRKLIDLMLETHTNMREEGPNFKEPVFLVGDFNVCANKNLFPKQGYLKPTKTNQHFFSFVEKMCPQDPHFSEYDYLKYILNGPEEMTNLKYEIKDFLKLNYGYHPVTFVESIHNQMQEEVINEMTEHDSMDFLFQLIPNGQKAESLKMTVAKDGAVIKPFRAPKDKPFKYTSDHLGVQLTVNISPNSNDK